MLRKQRIRDVLTGIGILFILACFILPATMKTNCEIRKPHVFIFNKTDEAYTFILYSKSEEVELVSTVIEPGESEYFWEFSETSINWETYPEGLVFKAENNGQSFTLIPEIGDTVPSAVSLTAGGLSVTHKQKREIWVFDSYQDKDQEDKMPNKNPSSS